MARVTARCRVTARTRVVITVRPPEGDWVAELRTHRTRVAPDTATLAVFDPARLRHRLSDAADWWTWPPDVLADLNAGNVVPVDPGADGVYHVTVHLDEDRPAADA